MPDEELKIKEMKMIVKLDDGSIHEVTTNDYIDRSIIQLLDQHGHLHLGPPIKIRIKQQTNN